MNYSQSTNSILEFNTSIRRFTLTFVNPNIEEKYQLNKMNPLNIIASFKISVLIVLLLLFIYEFVSICNDFDKGKAISFFFMLFTILLEAFFIFLKKSTYIRGIASLIYLTAYMVYFMYNLSTM